ncbi:hypothetical protein AWJ20_3883 [Sugiyamaella lignohabitans]|uniref:Uncharacterized protein n=1 Tax=Sugiyamaella lignohabitans TaxID=796027 RepID=A0A161HGT0_9ASCO|nr:uncharacterized protein AWJ20_3883 [Sugiyamaella lignohabitans]ANB11087.1 hypothetical protein AWJ20_3883 [Sugiyamaella lignohabitans]
MAIPLPEKELTKSADNATGSNTSNLDGTAKEPYPTSIPTIIGNVNISKEEAERLYEERIEDEYAKREGGA